MAVCGSYITVDIEAEADDLPLDDHSLDFVVASHVFEHTSNPIKTLMEWDRVLKSGGFLFLIVPKRDAPYGDSHREITPINHLVTAYMDSWTNADAHRNKWDRPAKEFDVMRGHVWVFDLLSLCNLLWYTNKYHKTHWGLVEAHETDDTDSTGHMAIFRSA